MNVVFISGPPASGKHTIGVALSEHTGLPLFHNHLAVDAAKSLFAFGTPGFRRLRAAIWRTAFAEAADAGLSFIFTFNPEATVDPALIDELCQTILSAGGQVHFIELICSQNEIRRRIGLESRTKFGKLTDPDLYSELKTAGAFYFPALPEPLLVIDSEQVSATQAAVQIASAIHSVVAR